QDPFDPFGHTGFGCVERILSDGDNRHWGEVYERFKRPVFATCLRLLGNAEDAMDMTSESFIKALESLDQYDRSRPFFPWLRRIARNLCIDRIRRDSRIRFVRPADWDTIGDSDNADEPADAGKDALAEGIRNAMERLKPAQKLCFGLFYVQDKSYDEIVRMTGYTYDQVRSHIQNGRRKLRLELNP
ncbi:MAG: sigma-70 family RNA polymerase sigma factor, partial [bacterium]|nr:sigma-70 family RNA polymerase sigma factor [bacterium]